MADDTIKAAVEAGYLSEICNYEGLGSKKPRGVAGLPPGYGVWPAPGIKKLIVEEKGGVLVVNQDVVDEMKAFGEQTFQDVNGNDYDEEGWKTKFGANPWWVLGVMRRNQGVTVHKDGPDPSKVVHLGRS